VHGRWREIGVGVLVGRYRFFDQDIGAVIGSDGVLVIDTRDTARQAREILTDLAAQTHLPVRWFVNTHWHHDHAFGNAEFRPAEGWGHVRCPHGLLANAERMRATVAAEEPSIAQDVAAVVIDPPEHVFDTTATIDIGGRIVELRHLGRGHTDADVVVCVPDAGVLFAGDLLENGAPPWFGDAYPLDWPSTVERLLPLAVGPVVPGHGDVADRTFVADQLEGFRALVALARRIHVEGHDMDEVLPEAPWGGGSLIREGLRRAIAQLRGELDEAKATPDGGGSAP
jgi:glyoxylase-like metal-dependent hydrolase (beta-lactamase superfamily II)